MDMESQLFQKYPLQSGEEILSLAFSPDGHRLALGLADNTIQTWDVQSHLPIGVPLQGHHGEVIFLSFNPDGYRFASVDWEHTFIMWDLQAADRLLTTTDTPTDTVGNIALSADGQYLATVADIQYGTRLNIMDMESKSSTGQTLSETELGLSPASSDISFLSDTHELVFYGYASDPFESQILLWDVDRRQPVWRISSASAPLSLSPDGRWLAGINKIKGEQDGKVALWDTQTGTLLRELEDSSRSVNGSKSPVKDELTILSFSPDSSLLAEGWGSGAVRLWYVDNGQPASPMLTGHFDQVTGLAFSPDGQTLASSSRDKTIRLWNVNQPSTASVELDGHTSWATGVAFSPDGRFLATTSLDGSTRIWDSQSYLSIGQLAGIEINRTFNPVFSSDGSRLFSGGARVMDISGSDSWEAYYDSGLVLQWEFGPAGWSHIGCSITQRNFSLSEWRSYLGTEAYRKTCEALPLHPSVVERFFQIEQDKLVIGGLEAALDDFVKTLPLEPALSNELQTRLKTLPLEDIARDTAQRVDTGEVEPAVKMYLAMRSLDRAEQVSSSTWNEICWNGSLWNQAAKVLDICELAVSLEPSDAGIRDSRGLALALTGKFNEAIQDFQSMMDWCKKYGCSDTTGSQREQWITALKSGQNPFDEQTLQSLRNR